MPGLVVSWFKICRDHYVTDILYYHKHSDIPLKQESESLEM